MYVFARKNFVLVRKEEEKEGFDLYAAVSNLFWRF